MESVTICCGLSVFGRAGAGERKTRFLKGADRGLFPAGRKDELRTMKVIGLTGQTGAGKTSVSEVIRSRGIPVIDADQVSRDVVAKQKECVADLALAFSITILNADGTLNRKRLASIVFCDPAQLRRLNTIIFPYIVREVNERVEALRKTGRHEMAVLDAPTLFESGCDSICDKVVSVIANETERLNRIVIRDRLTDEEARNRIASQQPDDFYVSRSQYVIENNGRADEIRLKTIELLERLKGDLRKEDARSEENHQGSTGAF